VNYEDKLQQGVSQDEAAGHRNWLKSYGMPLQELFDKLMRSGQFEHVFDASERASITEIRRIIGRKNIPMALVKVEDEDLSVLPKRLKARLLR